MLEGGRVLRGAALLASRPKAALDSGTLWHAWLAHIAWLEDGLPDDATLEALAERHAGELGALRGNLADWIRQFRQMLAQPAVAALLSRTFYRTPAWLESPEAVVGWPEGPSVPLELFREWSFALRRNDELISGAIDRLVLVRQGDAVLAADVIDFKTDVLPTNAWAHGALARRRDYYRPQVEAYREVVARTWALPLERVSARLVFLQAGKVVPLRRADAANRA
jgi:ATP-dependent exoDNAse (exonuclease V) beta subunit